MSNNNFKNNKTPFLQKRQGPKDPAQVQLSVFIKLPSKHSHHLFL